jgi:hypothetical protein
LLGLDHPAGANVAQLDQAKMLDGLPELVILGLALLTETKRRPGDIGDAGM